MKAKYFAGVCILGLVLVGAEVGHACGGGPGPCATPGGFHLTSPADTTSFPSTSGITLSWGPSTYADDYTVYLNTFSPPTTARVTQSARTWNVP
ncbi:MAG: hypothetical protein ACYS21_13870, partial [Planctomycetota bacterium]